MAHTILLNQQQLLHLLTPILRCYTYSLQHLRHISHVGTYILDTYMYISDTYVSDTYISDTYISDSFTSTSTLRQQETYDDFYFESLFLPHHNLPVDDPPPLPPHPLILLQSLDPPTSLNPPLLPFLGYSLHHFLLRSHTVLNILFHEQVLT